jgi:hypothetical protein
VNAKFHAPPTKAVIDYDAIVAHVQQHGYMLLDMSLNWNAAHVGLHNRGFGLRKVYDVRGTQIGWRTEPVRKHKPVKERK